MASEEPTQGNANEMFSQAARVFQTALEAGIRLQEQSTKTMGDFIAGFSSPQEWQAKAQAGVEQVMATNEKNMQDAVELMTENTKASLDLLEKAFAAQGAVAKGDGQQRTHELWETAIGSYMRNAELMVQANSRMLDSWRQMAQVIQTQEGPESANE